MVSAFSLPAGSAILPQLLAPEQLMQGNGLLIATLQLGQVLGPIAGGLLIDALPGSQPGKTMESAGIGLAFLTDAASFCLSIFLLSRVKLQRPYKAQGSSGVLDQVRAGFAYVLADKALCYFITYGALVNLLILGPVTVGLPLFATQILGGSSSTYGILASFYGAGALTGTVASGLIPRAPARLLGPIILGCDVVIGGLLAGVTSAHSAPPACALLFGMGAVGGYVMTSVFTWVQSRVPRMLIGRVISILMFSTLGLMPLSSAVAGELIARTSIRGVLGGAALCMVGAAAVAFMIGRIRTMGTEPSPQATPAKEVAG
jgi:MFS family permease